MGIKNILWDFDGVILDSMKVRDWGFREIFKKFNKDEVDKLIEYHRENGGLSRYVKIRYFYENILERPIKKEEVLDYAENFSFLMKTKLTDKSNLIQDSVRFIQGKFNDYNFHIVSGSDQEELRFLCHELDLSKFFLSIHGSPTAKKILVKDLISNFNYDKNKTILIGDSINDYDAAVKNDIDFYGYNEITLDNLSKFYIHDFNEFNSYLNE
jgi:phosphoglycolate phosphatase-like HAD superfamily hydrolase